MVEKIIEQIYVNGIGWIYADSEPIEAFTVNGEMALVAWYRKGNEEYNGRYVQCIKYK